MSLKNYAWTLPFFAFLSGYLICMYVASTRVCHMPRVLGMSLYDAMLATSSRGLHARVLDQKPDDDREPGTVLHQLPHPGQKLKVAQPVFFVVACAPERPQVPCFRGEVVSRIDELCQDLPFDVRTFALPCQAYVDGRIIAQSHCGECVSEHETVACYAAVACPWVIVPDLTGLHIEEARFVVHEAGHEVAYETEGDGYVVQQKPLPGTILSTADTMTFRFVVRAD